MPFTTTPSIGICTAITRLRRGVTVCCWIAGLALACQALIWSLASFTQLRYEVAPDAEPSVAAEPSPQSPAQSGRLLPPPAAPVVEEPVEAEPVGPILSRYDAIFNAVFDLAGGVGRFGMIVLLCAMGLGVILGASASVPGAERSVLALIWALVVALLVLPLGNVLRLPWEDGALTTYATMTEWADGIDAYRAASLSQPLDEAAPSALVFHARFFLLPLACIVGIVLVGLRFSVAVEAAVVKRESMKLDPALEREAANISPTSLHGPRGVSVIGRAIAPALESEPVTTSATEEPLPKRLI